MPPLKPPWKRATRPRRNNTIRSGQSCRYQHHQAFRAPILSHSPIQLNPFYYSESILHHPTWAAQPYQGKSNLIKSRIARVPDYLAPQIPSILHLLRPRLPKLPAASSCHRHLPTTCLLSRLDSVVLCHENQQTVLPFSSQSTRYHCCAKVIFYSTSAVGTRGHKREVNQEQLSDHLLSRSA